MENTKKVCTLPNENGTDTHEIKFIETDEKSFYTITSLIDHPGESLELVVKKGDLEATCHDLVRILQYMLQTKHVSLEVRSQLPPLSTRIYEEKL